jgi:hypothetical protein
MRERGKFDSYHISGSRNRPFNCLAEITIEPLFVDLHAGLTLLLHLENDPPPAR